MIVATAGHIDHGKTLLVRALTGVDTDRLPEEQRRGMTIDLGFAYRQVADGDVIGFVDVPGHERFIRNMLAGVTGIDFALLVVAADDGPMPQTLEHLAILDLLKVEAGAVALTKIDRVPAERREEVTALIRDRLAGTSLAQAPILPVSAVTGEGIPALLSQLERAQQAIGRRVARGNFRLAVDRVFTLRGVGLVVTGTAFAGSVKVGDRLMLTAQGLAVRVRGIHAQNRATHAAGGGERLALNVTGPGKEAVHRGDWMVAEVLHAPTRRIDVRLRVLPGEEGPLRDRAPVHFHLGAGATTGRMALLDRRQIEPGESALVQILLDREIGALHGDRFVVRDQSARRTIGGGRVIDPTPPARGRRRPERLSLLEGLDTDDPAAALNLLLERSPTGVVLEGFVRTRNLAPADAGALWRRVPMRRIGEQLALSTAHWDGLCATILAALAAWHRVHPESPGVDLERLRRGLALRPSAALFAAAAGELQRTGQLVRDGAGLHLPGHLAALTGEEGVLWRKVEPLLEAGDLRPPRVREIAAAIGIDHEDIESLLKRAAYLGLVLKVADNRFFPPLTVARLATLAEQLAAETDDGMFTAGAYKDRSGIGRNVTIQLLEFFDKHGFTKRDGEARRIVRPAGSVFQPPR